MNIFEQVFKALNKHKVDYMVVGGVAVNLHGFLRFTGDLDLLLLLDEKNLEKMNTVMKELKYSERLPVSIMSLKDHAQVKKWLKEKNMKAFTFNPPYENPLQVDIVIEESLKFEKMKMGKITKKVEGVSIPLVSIDQLIRMKRKANRAQDLIDLKALVKLKTS